MTTPEQKSSFAALEKQLAKDSLEEALQRIHEEVIKDIEKNKAAFSQEIQRTLDDFKEDISGHISEEVENKISAHLEQNIQSINSRIESSFSKMFFPVLERTENDMKRLHIQGEDTLNSWADMMKHYTGFWTRPFFLLFCSAIFTGLVISLVLSYFMMREQKKTVTRYANVLQTYQDVLLLYREKAKEKETKSNTNKMDKPKLKTNRNKKN